jgi:hypothetical protein
MSTVWISKLRTAMLARTLAVTAVASISHTFAQGQVMQVNAPFAFHNEWLSTHRLESTECRFSPTM